MGTDVAVNIKGGGGDSVCGWNGVTLCWGHQSWSTGGSCWGGEGLDQTTQGEWSLSAFGSWETRHIVWDSNELLSPALHFNLLSRTPGSHSSGLAGSTHTHTTITPNRPKKRVWRTRGGRPFDGGRREEGEWHLALFPSLSPLSLTHPISHSDIHRFLFNLAYRCKETSVRKIKGTTKRAVLRWKAEGKEWVAWSFLETQCLLIRHSGFRNHRVSPPLRGHYCGSFYVSGLNMAAILIPCSYNLLLRPNRRVTPCNFPW